MQALAVAGDDFETMRPVVADHGKRTAGFQYGEDTHQSFGNPVLLGKGACHGFLRLTAGMGVRRFQIAVGATGLCRGRLGVRHDTLGFRLKEFPGFLEQNTPPGQIPPKGILWKQ